MNPMKQIVFYILLSTISTILLISCKKYPDGPGISVISKKERLSNVWHLASYFENGVDKTTDFNNAFQNAVITINKTGDYSLKYKAWGLINYSESGTWRITNKNANFETNPTSGSGSVGSHRILRLKEQELWYEDTDANGTKEYHLIP